MVGLSEQEEHLKRTEDSNIMEMVKNGDTGKLAILFERYHIRLFNFFLRLSGGKREQSEDLVQEVFIRILKYRGTYDHRNLFVVWLYRISRNVFNDHLRKIKPEYENEDAIARAASPVPGPEEQLEKGDLEEKLSEALWKLPADKREILIMSKFEKLKCREIAEILNCRTGAVKVRIFRSLKELEKKYLEVIGGELL